MTQVAPYPAELAVLVDGATYKPGWVLRLAEDYDRGQGSRGLTLSVTVVVPDSYHPATTIRVRHLFPVPPAAYDARSWRRWLLDRILDVESHEACEFLQIDGERPWAPSHGPGNDPYLIREVGTDEDRRTSFQGVLR